MDRHVLRMKEQGAHEQPWNVFWMSELHSLPYYTKIHSSISPSALYFSSNKLHKLREASTATFQWLREKLPSMLLKKNPLQETLLKIVQGPILSLFWSGTSTFFKGYNCLQRMEQHLQWLKQPALHCSSPCVMCWAATGQSPSGRGGALSHCTEAVLRPPTAIFALVETKPTYSSFGQ